MLGRVIALAWLRLLPVLRGFEGRPATMPGPSRRNDALRRPANLLSLKMGAKNVRQRKVARRAAKIICASSGRVQG